MCISVRRLTALMFQLAQKLQGPRLAGDIGALAARRRTRPAQQPRPFDVRTCGAGHRTASLAHGYPLALRAAGRVSSRQSRRTSQVGARCQLAPRRSAGRGGAAGHLTTSLAHRVAEHSARARKPRASSSAPTRGCGTIASRRSRVAAHVERDIRRQRRTASERTRYVPCASPLPAPLTSPTGPRAPKGEPCVQSVITFTE